MPAVGMSRRPGRSPLRPGADDRDGRRTGAYVRGGQWTGTYDWKGRRTGADGWKGQWIGTYDRKGRRTGADYRKGRPVWSPLRNVIRFFQFIWVRCLICVNTCRYSCRLSGRLRFFPVGPTGYARACPLTAGGGVSRCFL